MTLPLQSGLYGKLPMHGDFIHRNLPSTFITIWDEWLQHYVAGSKEHLGDEWLDIYLTSPIWRFVLSSGVINEQHWAGVMMPSVDQVGRYYPFSIVTPIPPELNPLEFISLERDWFEKMEELSLLALDEQLLVDELFDEISAIESNFVSSHKNTGQIMETSALQINLEFEEQLPMSVYPHLLDSILMKTNNSYSLWTTKGSERIEPCLFNVKGLPAVSNIPAMMDGQWAYWGWQQTYTVSDSVIAK